MAALPTVQLHPPKLDRPSSSSAAAVCPPSLNQLAARINISSGPTTSSSPTRPRLAASLLRTGSQSSLSTSTSTATNDSIAVNPSTTRSVSPAVTPSAANPTALDPLSIENLKELNATTDKDKERERKVKGYKNIPSLDAITARLAKTRSLSVDGSARAPEPELVQDPKTPGATMKPLEHPLQFTWTIYHDSKAKSPLAHAKATPNLGAGLTGNIGDASPPPFLPAPPESDDYEASLTHIGEFNTVESFCRYFKWLKPPSQLDLNSNYHIFKSGIKPMWEDPANCGGGKWVVTLTKNRNAANASEQGGLLDACWQYVAMALVGEELEEEDEICGAVVSLRSKVDRIQVWTRSREDVERLNGLGRGLMRVLGISDMEGVGLEFQYNINDRPPPNKFLSIQPSPPSTSRCGIREHAHGHSKGSFGSPMSDGGTPINGALCGFGGVGVGAGTAMGGSSGWRGKRT